MNLARGLSRSSGIVAGIAALFLIRLYVAAVTPLSADEAYYWLWSRNLAWGYYDHPPLIAFAIREGTAMLGDTSLGVRCFVFLFSVLASWAVWRSAKILLGSDRAALLSVLIFNLMPMVGVEALVATPDAPAIATAALLLFALAKVMQTGLGAWWILAGVAAGLALLSKYTGFFLGAGILAWLIADPRQRHWFASPWPYLGATIALAMFVPVVLWNAGHGWISFAAQFGRVGSGGWTLRYLAEFLGGQLALASPFLAVLGAAGIIAGLRRSAPNHAGLLLLAALMAPATVYFLVHALHDRVQGNWPSFLYPAFAIAVVAASEEIARKNGRGAIWRWTRYLGTPVAIFMTMLIYVQAVFGIIPIIREPVSRLLAVGIDTVVTDIQALEKQSGATAIVTTGYAPLAVLSFYMPGHPRIVQLNERYRWLDQPAPLPSFFDRPLLYVTDQRTDKSDELKKRFASVERLALIGRYRSGAELEEFMVYRVEGLRGDPYF